MTAPRIFNLGIQRVVMAHGVVENAPCVFLHEGLETSDPDAAPTEAEVAALTRNGVVLRQKMLADNAAAHAEQAEEAEEAELLDAPVFKSKRKRGAGYDK
jgi:hypothetical protein